MIKKSTLLILTILLTASLSSCGDAKKEIAKVSPEKTSISGDLGQYLQIVDNEYEVTEDWGGNLSIKVKALKPMSSELLDNNDFEINASLLGSNGMPISGTEQFDIEYKSKDKLLSLLKDGNGEEVIELKSLTWWLQSRRPRN
ncbi:hypothetical protein [Winogradskyella wichelsiae]|uniref:hypothetical protein n=1 Tax=Winogradskyella wichelsiae TaxID=2697007 RepID=UPI003EF9E8DE